MKPYPKRKDLRDELRTIDSEVVGEQSEGGDGLEEIATPTEIEREEGRDRDNAALPSDMRDEGDPEAGDVGVPGGYAAGGEASLGGSGGLEDSEPKKDRSEEEDMGGSGNINPEDRKKPAK